MCPHKVSRPLTPNYEVAPPPPPPIRLYVCQKTALCNRKNSDITFCEPCLNRKGFSQAERLSWRRIYKHTLTIDGVSTQHFCQNCRKLLTELRFGEECYECLTKFNEYQEDPDLAEAVYFEDDDTVVINIEIYGEDVE